MINPLKQWALSLKRETYALFFIYMDPRVPWYAKILVVLVVAHTLSPIDLIPDFIPILVYLDDLIITPLGLATAIKFIQKDVMADTRLKVESSSIEDNKLCHFELYPAPCPLQAQNLLVRPVRSLADKKAGSSYATIMFYIITYNIILPESF